MVSTPIRDGRLAAEEEAAWIEVPRDQEAAEAWSGVQPSTPAAARPKYARPTLHPVAVEERKSALSASRVAAHWPLHPAPAPAAAACCPPIRTPRERSPFQAGPRAEVPVSVPWRPSACAALSAPRAFARFVAATCGRRSSERASESALSSARHLSNSQMNSGPPSSPLEHLRACLSAGSWDAPRGRLSVAWRYRVHPTSAGPDRSSMARYSKLPTRSALCISCTGRCHSVFGARARHRRR